MTKSNLRKKSIFGAQFMDTVHHLRGFKTPHSPSISASCPVVISCGGLHFLEGEASDDGWLKHLSMGILGEDLECSKDIGLARFFAKVHDLTSQEMMARCPVSGMISFCRMDLEYS